VTVDAVAASKHTVRVTRWRTPGGSVYDAPEPRDAVDEAMMHRADVDTETVVLGAFPDLGEVSAPSMGEHPFTTIRTHVEGPWRAAK